MPFFVIIWRTTTAVSLDIVLCLYFAQCNGPMAIKNDFAFKWLRFSMQNTWNFSQKTVILCHYLTDNNSCLPRYLLLCVWCAMQWSNGYKQKPWFCLQIRGILGSKYSQMKAKTDPHKPVSTPSLYITRVVCTIFCGKKGINDDFWL